MDSGPWNEPPCTESSFFVRVPPSALTFWICRDPGEVLNCMITSTGSSLALMANERRLFSDNSPEIFHALAEPVCPTADPTKTVAATNRASHAHRPRLNRPPFSSLLRCIMRISPFRYVFSETDGVEGHKITSPGAFRRNLACALPNCTPHTKQQEIANLLIFIDLVSTTARRAWDNLSHERLIIKSY